jgi:hypothetical protein
MTFQAFGLTYPGFLILRHVSLRPER